VKTGQSELLQRYEALVRAWAPKLDLVAPGDLDSFRGRHIEDSLRLLPLLEQLPAGPCADVGSGAGLPGVPLAIASGRHWRLIEPRKRRAAFLEEVVRDLDLDCAVVARRVGEVHGDTGFARAHALVTGRALAPPAEAIDLLRPLVASDGLGAIFIGARAKAPKGSRLWEPGIAIFEGDAAAEGKQK
jgi:16S rRNA (guanine527-N7)-methyltransferase